MKKLYATHSASISELKQNPTKLINDADGEPVVILNNNEPAAYLVPTDLFEILLNYIDEDDLEVIVQRRLKDNQKPIQVNIDELS